MFIGHYAVALAAKKASPKTSLGTLIFAAQFLDLLWPILLIAGVEHVRIDPGNTAFTPLDFYDYPYSHSLLFVGLWAVLIGGGYYALKRNTKAALLIGSLVLSHWFLDLVVHRPDMPVLPSGPLLGFGLWNSVAATWIVETALFGAGVWLYRSTLAKQGLRPHWAFWALIGFLAVIAVANGFSPPPPSVEAIAYSALLLWLLPPWAAWAERRSRSV